MREDVSASILRRTRSFRFIGASIVRWRPASADDFRHPRGVKAQPGTSRPWPRGPDPGDKPGEHSPASAGPTEFGQDAHRDPNLPVGCRAWRAALPGRDDTLVAAARSRVVLVEGRRGAVALRLPQGDEECIGPVTFGVEDPWRIDR